ncbi:hypothetical protein [Undibacterium sp. RuTC16W]|uniref:hypothetical protein n=1 Tax=Undibacterium sp. RuTC16W TaxID=3413048 RepID=UPI003BF16774
MSITGGKEERTKLKQFHIMLNHANIVPEQSYRMSGTIYPLVCYVNNIVALYGSKNYEVSPIFISRVINHMDDHPAPPAASAYYDMIARYIRQMTYVLKNYSEIRIETLELFVPAEVLHAGSQEILANDVGIPKEF